MTLPKRPNESKLKETITEMLKDYEDLSGPFNENNLPEKQVIRDIESKKEKALFLTLTVSIDYQKETEGENGLWKTSMELWKRKNWIFRPQKVVETEYSRLIDIFEDIGWNWKDPHIWYRISLTLYRNFNSNPLNLIEKNESDAVNTRRYIRQKNPKKFPYLKGDKINPLWLRLMHEEVHPLSRIKEIPLPVDTHIISISNYLQEENYSDSRGDKKKIREFWRKFCKDNNIIPVKLDQPLWLIHKHWNSWGKNYLEKTLN